MADDPFAPPLARLAPEAETPGACPVCGAPDLERGHLHSGMSIDWYPGAKPRAFSLARRGERVSGRALSDGYLPALRCRACRTVLFSAR